MAKGTKGTKGIRSNIIRPSKILETHLMAEMGYITDHLTADYWHSIEPLFTNGLPDPDLVANVLAAQQAKAQQDYFHKLDAMAKVMADEASITATVQVNRFVRGAYKQLEIRPVSLQAGGRYEQVFKAVTQETANLFKTIPEKFHDQVAFAVNQSIANGKGLQDLVPFFEKHSTGMKNYAKHRALDQTRKATQGLALERMKAAGVTKFEWLHTGGGKEPRKLHQDLSRKVFNIDEPPFIGVMYGERIHGYPGQLPNCRCSMRAVIL